MADWMNVCIHTLETNTNYCMPLDILLLFKTVNSDFGKHHWFTRFSTSFFFSVCIHWIAHDENRISNKTIPYDCVCVRIELHQMSVKRQRWLATRPKMKIKTQRKKKLSTCWKPHTTVSLRYIFLGSIWMCLNWIVSNYTVHCSV